MTVTRNLPRDVFLHLLAIVALYWSAISFVTLVYQYINYFFPLTIGYYGPQSFSSAMRFAIASLIIIFPVYLLTSWSLNKIYAKESEVRESKVRKWLIYLTLFVAALVIIGDLVTAINFLLNGDFTVRFTLKVLTILVVAGGIFGYYLDDVRSDKPSKLAKPFAIGAGVLVIIAVVAAFFIIGSPKTAREMQYDQQRVYDLQGIQSQVVYFWQSKQKLPASLAELNDPLSNFTVPVDPETRQSYEYSITGASAMAFQLCATFTHPSEDQATLPKAITPVRPGDLYSQNWNHSSGRICFDRAIDPQLYPPFVK